VLIVDVRRHRRAQSIALIRRDAAPHAVVIALDRQEKPLKTASMSGLVRCNMSTARLAGLRHCAPGRLLQYLALHSSSAASSKPPTRNAEDSLPVCTGLP
jgi:hypothetical protein